jgi:hypothetical protein
VPETLDFRSVANPFSGTEQRNMLRTSKPKNILKVKVYGQDEEDFEEEKVDEKAQAV